MQAQMGGGSGSASGDVKPFSSTLRQARPQTSQRRSSNSRGRDSSAGGAYDSRSSVQPKKAALGRGSNTIQEEQNEEEGGTDPLNRR